MKAEETVNRIRGALNAHLEGYEQRSEHRVYLRVAPETVTEASRLMFQEIGARLQIMTGIDTGEGIEVLYHWALDGEDCVVTVFTVVDRDAPALESIASFCPAAEWIEREIWELLGVDFIDHPDLRHLLLSDDWPEGDYPLRKDISARGTSIAAEAAPTGGVIAAEAAPTGSVEAVGAASAAISCGDDEDGVKT